MPKNGGANTVQLAQKLAEPILESLELRLWDLRFEKEGAEWYLRFYIDKPGGVNIKDCENFSRAMGRILDDADPIDQSYMLEVSSPGAERQLSKGWHFTENMGGLIHVRLIRPVDGVRDFVGELTGYDGGTVTILIDMDNEQETGTEMVFTKKEAAYIKLYVDFETGGQKG